MRIDFFNFHLHDYRGIFIKYPPGTSTYELAIGQIKLNLFILTDLG